MTFSALAGEFWLAWATPSANNTAKVSARENRDRMRGAVYASPESFACVYPHAAIVFTIALRVCTTGRQYDGRHNESEPSARSHKPHEAHKAHKVGVEYQRLSR